MNRPEVQHIRRGRSGKGIMKTIRANKRDEAEARNENTEPWRTRRHRLTCTQGWSCACNDPVVVPA